MTGQDRIPQPQQPVAKAPSLVVPDNVDLGDVEVGSWTSSPVQIYNVDPSKQGIGWGVRYVGDPSIQITSHPGYFRPVTEDTFNNDENATMLAFVPTHQGRVTGALSVEVVGQAPLEVPIHAAAHLPGAPTLDQQDAERERAARDETVAKQKSEREKRLAEDHELHNHDHKHHGDNYIDDKNRFDEAKDNAEVALSKLYELRKVGVTIARAEASKFTREVPEHEVSIAMELGMFALNFATEGIAAVVSKRLEGLLEIAPKAPTTIMTNQGPRPIKMIPGVSKDVVQFFSNGVKDELKGAAKPRIAQLSKSAPPHKPNEPARDPEALSSDPVIGFFGAEETSLVMQNYDVAKRVVLGAYRSLLPLLDTQPELATAALQLCADGLEAEGTNANRIQADASSQNWVRFLAQQSLGDVTPEAAQGRLYGDKDGLSTADVSRANSAPSQTGESATFDGLIDIGFQVEIDHPETPVTVGKAVVHGVSKSMASRIGTAPLIEQRLPVRAYGLPSRDADTVPIAVVRDEAGNIQYTDETSVGGMARPSWLARKAGQVHATAAAEREGARKLIEKEVMATALGETLKSDSSS